MLVALSPTLLATTEGCHGKAFRWTFCGEGYLHAVFLCGRPPKLAAGVFGYIEPLEIVATEEKACCNGSPVGNFEQMVTLTF